MWIIGLVIFIASFIRSSLGFGGALVAMPVLSLLFGLEFATPIVGLMSLLCALLIIGSEWRNIQFEVVKKFLLSIIIGIPLGIWLIKMDIEALMKVILGLVIIFFAIYELFNFIKIKLKNDKLAPLFGLVAGVFGGAYNVNGPVVVMFGVLRGWNPITFKATLQGVFLPMSMLAVTGHAIGGLWTMEVLKTFAILVPIIVGAVYFGKISSDRINKDLFSRIVYIFLIFIGGALIFQNVVLI